MGFRIESVHKVTWRDNNKRRTIKTKVYLLSFLGLICSSLAGVNIFSRLMGLLDGGAFSS